MLDLGRWLDEGYGLPAAESDEQAELPRDSYDDDDDS